MLAKYVYRTRYQNVSSDGEHIRIKRSRLDTAQRYRTILHSRSTDQAKLSGKNCRPLQGTMVAG